MFPTCSNRLLAGRNALSATDLTIVSSGCRDLPAASATTIFDPLAVRHPQPRRGPRGRTGRAEPAAVVCSPRFGGGDRHKRPPAADHAPRSSVRGIAASALAAVALGARRLRRRQAERQDANEPAGEFPVAVNAAKFPTEQRLAQTSDLQLEIENTGYEHGPEPRGDDLHRRRARPSGSFSVRSDQPGLADPNRPVWILENGFPKLVERRRGRRRARRRAASPAPPRRRPTPSPSARSTPGETKDIVWRVTPVQAGTYTVHYELAAGLNGKAKAVTDDGEPGQGRVRRHDHRQAAAGARRRHRRRRDREPVDARPAGPASRYGARRCGFGR